MPTPGLQMLTPPASEPVTLMEAKVHCRVSSLNTIEDDLLSGLIVSAREHIERMTDRALGSRRYLLTLDCFHGRTHLLPRPPLQVVESIKYLDMDAVQQTLSTDVYEVDAASDPGRIMLADGESWPQTYPSMNAVEIRYVAGFGPVTRIAGATSAGAQTITPASMTGIYVGTVVGIDVGELFELVTVTAVTGTTFDAVFVRGHDVNCVINCVPRGYQSAMKLLIYDWYWTRGDIPPPGLTGLATPNGVAAILQSLGHGEVF